MPASIFISLILNQSNPDSMVEVSKIMIMFYILSVITFALMLPSGVLIVKVYNLVQLTDIP
jgi:Na+-transporting methylmalonyl-CoA/oxaloacetate decarboxylase beta subunit